MNTRNNQTGRSMIEIMGVLAVMGLLASASIWSVRYAFYVHRENQTIDTISKTVAGAITGYMENSGIGEAVEGTAGRIQLAAEQVMSGVPTKNGGMTITAPLDTELTVWVPASNTVEVEVENVTYSVCDRILISNSDYVSAWLTGKDWEGVYYTDPAEVKRAFCRERVDALQRTAYNPEPAVNPDANITLCSSSDEGNCKLTPPPPTSCPGGYALNSQVNECGWCDRNGVITIDKTKFNEPCERCETTDWSVQPAGEGVSCGYCSRCQGGRCVSEEKTVRHSDWDAVACKCVEEEETYCEEHMGVIEARSCAVPAKPACSGACCKLDETNKDGCGNPLPKYGTMRVDTYQEKNANGCCVTVTKNYCDLEPAPEHAACTNSNANICKQCDGNGNLVNVANGSNMQGNGKCCVNGALAYDATLCPEPTCPSGYSKTACVAGTNYQTDVKTLIDGSKCYKCESCPTSNSCPANACCTSVTTPANAATKCPAYTTYTLNYQNGAAVNQCGKCVNGSIVTDSSKVPTCKVCNADGTLGNAANGTAVGTCKQCSNGSVVAKSGYTVPTCKVCNADGTLGNAANGTAVGSCGKCSNGTVISNASACPAKSSPGASLYSPYCYYGQCYYTYAYCMNAACTTPSGGGGIGIGECLDERTGTVIFRAPVYSILSTLCRQAAADLNKP